MEQRRCMAAIARLQENKATAGDWVEEDCERKLGYICQRGKPSIVNAMTIQLNISIALVEYMCYYIPIFSFVFTI